MSDISREELAAFTEANTKSAVALEKITGTLESIVAKQDKLFDKLTNGVSQVIIAGINDNYNINHRGTMDALSRVEEGQKGISEAVSARIPEILNDKINNSKIAKDIEHVKWFVGIVGIVVIVVMVILRVIGSVAVSKTTEEQNKVLIHMLEVHMKDAAIKGE